MESKKLTKVIGLGNPILGDDGVGWRVADEIEHQLSEKGYPFERQFIQIEKASLGGLSLMELLIDSDQAIIIDAIETHQFPIGTVRKLKLADIPDLNSGHTASTHDTSLVNAIEVGKLMGAHLPESITIISIEAENLFEFSEELSPHVKQAIPLACQYVWQTLIELEEKP